MEIATREPDLVDEAELEELVALGHRVGYPPKSVLVREGERTDFVLYLLSGHLKVVTGRPPAIVRLYRPGSVAGERAAVTGHPRSADLVAVNRVEAIMVSGRDWYEFIQRHPGMLLRLYADSLNRLESRDPSKSESVPTAEMKVASSLLLLLKSGLGESGTDGHLICGITQQDLGYLNGMSRESVSIGLRSLRERGAVTTGRSRILVHDLDDLERVSQRNYRTAEPL
ncbi:Crp/Fnr family transcriptional regulator [Glycomyces xiaoerkulensis]|uniref:Crp/Fnr family transcriptional regulator n=1 Tax=Glycomyces xiaoerkulensis TaxID=2038139 RepID=UPI0018E4D5B0|nr:Crp/Fnr family transcriptional regulator [Glycomyces xiaoerkulensis]